MKFSFLLTLALVSIQSQSYASDSGEAVRKPYLTCSIQKAGDRIPRKLKVYLNRKTENWNVAFATAGVREDRFTLLATGDVHTIKATGDLRSADFTFEDQTTLEIEFKQQSGIAKSNNMIFKHLNEAELTECEIHPDYN